MKRTCTMPECGKPHRARGLCNTHYGQQHQPERHKKRTQSCAWCGTVVYKHPRSGAKYGVTCSTACRGYLLAITLRGEERSPCQELALVARPTRTDQRPRPARRPGKHFGGTCPICLTTFLSIHTRMTCSPECQAIRDADVRRDHKHRYRARKRDAMVAPVSPLAIYRRDGWTCRLCSDPIDRGADPQSPLAPSLDHVIPLANGGSHEPSNVWTAHMQCNSERTNRPFTIDKRSGKRVSSLF